MSVSKAIIVPHPPLIIPKIGLGQEAGVQKTSRSYHKAAKAIADQKPETIIVLTPHGVAYSDYFCIASGDEIAGSLKEYGSSEVISARCDTEFIQELERICKQEEFPAGRIGKSQGTIDHGTYVPLYFINQYYTDYQIVCISMSGLSLREHYRFGMYIHEAIMNTRRNAVIVASGDLSHKLKAHGPYGYSKEGPKLDEIMTHAMKTGDFLELLEIDEEVRQRGAECGLGSFAAMAGGLHKKEVEIDFLSYEGPFGIGYAVSLYDIKGTDEKRDFLEQYDCSKAEKMKKIRQSEDPYVKLARETLEYYIKNRRLLLDYENLVSELTDEKAGVFVTIKKHGQLRGCIGTLEPTQDNIALEIIYNAVSAGTRDPRFPEVELDELAELIYSVDVMFMPEPVENIDELDPIQYGIIVTSGHKRGVLLPDLAEVDTVEEQISIACKKAGIDEEEEYKIERFEVVRHHVDER